MDIPWDKLLSQNPVENIQGIGDLLKPAHDAVCQLYAAAPVWSLGPQGVTGSILGINKLLFDTLCPSVPPPPPTTTPPPFTGGQCQKQYNILVVAKSAAGQYAGQYFTRPTGAQFGPFLGPISNVYLSYPSDPGQATLCKADTGNGTQNLFDFGGGHVPGDFELTQIQVSTADGSPDNCGDHPGGTNAVPPPPDSARNSNGTINLNNGLTVNWNIKNVYDPKTVNNNNFANIPVNIYLGGDTSYYIPVTFSWGNVNFNFGGDGQHYQNDSSAAAAGNTVNFNNISGTLNAVNNNLLGFGLALNNTVNNAPPEPGSKTTNPNKPTDPKQVTNKKYLYGVEVHLTTIPAKAREQWGSGSPDVIYGGWFEFQRDGNSFPREPINFKDCVFLAPQGANGYAYTLYGGFDGYAIEIINTSTSNQ